MTRPFRSRIRIWVNRFTVATVLMIAMPLMIVASRRGTAAARRVAVRWAQRAARLAGVEFRSLGDPPGGGRQMRVLVANHSSPLDIPALLLACPEVTFVGAADLFRVPLLAAAMRAVGTVAVDRRSGSQTRLTVPDTSRAAGSSLVVFPEGGIAPSGARMPFRRGAFALAIEEGAEIIPVAIHGSSRVLPPRAALGISTGTVIVEFLEPIPTVGLSPDDRYRVCEEAEKQILSALGPSDGGSAPEGRVV